MGESMQFAKGSNRLLDAFHPLKASMTITPIKLNNINLKKKKVGKSSRNFHYKIICKIYFSEGKSLHDNLTAATYTKLL